MPKPGYYAVRQGKKRGLFNSWAECEAQVKGFPQAEYKKFKTQQEADNYLQLESASHATSKLAVLCKQSPAMPIQSTTCMSTNQSRKRKSTKSGDGHCYAVRRGHSTGIYTSWVDCEQQIRGYSGAQYSKCQSRAEAEEFLAAVGKECTQPQSSMPFSAPSRDPMVLSRQQHRGLRRILSGHHVFLSGSAGTGKSFLVKVLREVYAARGWKGQLAITASTGCAAVGVKGQTIHSWAGVGTGLGSDLSAEDLFGKLGKHNVRSWQETALLLIDEVSMISARELDKLSDLAKLVRRSSDPFGGLQVVLCGDFLQLPPVSKQGPAAFCFESDVWRQLFPEDELGRPCRGSVIILDRIQRQKDPTFQNILNSLRVGRVTSEVDKFLLLKSQSSCATPSESSSQWFTRRTMAPRAVKLYSRVADVTRINALYLNGLPSKKTVIVDARDSVDFISSNDRSGLATRLNTETPAPRTLQLKRGAQVMLIANLDPKIGLVNGARGRVVGFECGHDQESGEDVVLPVVRFAIAASSLAGAEEEVSRRRRGMASRLAESNRGYQLFTRMGYRPWRGLGKHAQGSPDPMGCPLANQCSMGTGSVISATVERTLDLHTFHLRNSSDKILATRRQVPLILAYAITIHKTQGMSLPEVEVNMGGIFTSGQAYVALSRSVSEEGLTVRDYSRRLVFSHPAAIRFYEDVEKSQRGFVTDADTPENKQKRDGGGVAHEGVSTSIYDLCQQTKYN